MKLSTKITRAFVRYIHDSNNGGDYDIIDLEAYIQKEVAKEQCPLKKGCFNLKEYNGL